MNTLNDDIWYEIQKFLQIKDLTKVSQVNIKYKNIMIKYIKHKLIPYNNLCYSLKYDIVKERFYQWLSPSRNIYFYYQVPDLKLLKDNNMYYSFKLDILGEGLIYKKFDFYLQTYEIKSYCLLDKLNKQYDTNFEIMLDENFIEEVIKKLFPRSKDSSNELI